MGNEKNPFIVRVTDWTNGHKYRVELVYDPEDRSKGMGNIKLRKHTSFGDKLTTSEIREAVRLFLPIWEAKEEEAGAAHGEACAAYNATLDHLDQISAKEYLDLEEETENTSIAVHDACAIRYHLEKMMK